jgi:ABC-2 type transport system ATP-binding protein
MSRDTAPPLSLRGVTKKYGDVIALSGLDLDVKAGEAVALIGHNGSGKTTAVRVAAGHLKPTAGRVEVAGVDVHGGLDAHHARAALAFVPDNPVLYDDITVFEHLQLLALAHGATDDLEERADALLEELGLADRADFLPTQLSRGMRQKAQLACAFIRPFAVIVLDEPVVGLDPPSQERLREILIQAKEEGAAVLLATHQLAFAEGLVDRAFVLSSGKVVDEGRFADVLAGSVASGLGLR